ncbi:putative DMBT1-like protein [Sturnira hondurensis]|uniref:putative DMBT1-like protein n=1 Tax=Sturnira hondurensis TaxID=192404 RepID=UPI001878FE8F|nr:putative DMBT1-like protein [Sturnira hondurensis]
MGCPALLLWLLLSPAVTSDEAGWPQLQLVNGSSKCSGRVEVFYHGQWGRVCDDQWDMKDADVVCRQLNCGHALSVPVGARFGGGEGNFLLEDVDCTGEESFLGQCPHAGWSLHNCSTREDASVVCSAETEYLKPALENAGESLPMPQGDRNSATILSVLPAAISTHLPPTTVAPPTSPAAPSTSSVPEDVNHPTTPSELPVVDSPPSSRRAKVPWPNTSEAWPTMRLINGTGRCSGRVVIFYQGTWGSVCVDGWGLKEVQVVCRQLGCGQAVSAPPGSHFGPGFGKILLDNVHCSGEESHLALCVHDTWFTHTCGHEEDAGAICSGSLSAVLTRKAEAELSSSSSSPSLPLSASSSSSSSSSTLSLSLSSSLPSVTIVVIIITTVIFNVIIIIIVIIITPVFIKNIILVNFITIVIIIVITTTTVIIITIVNFITIVTINYIIVIINIITTTTVIIILTISSIVITIVIINIVTTIIIIIITITTSTIIITTVVISITIFNFITIVIII